MLWGDDVQSREVLYGLCDIRDMNAAYAYMLFCVTTGVIQVIEYLNDLPDLFWVPWHINEQHNIGGHKI